MTLLGSCSGRIFHFISCCLFLFVRLLILPDKVPRVVGWVATASIFKRSVSPPFFSFRSPADENQSKHGDSRSSHWLAASTNPAMGRTRRIKPMKYSPSLGYQRRRRRGYRFHFLNVFVPSTDDQTQISFLLFPSSSASLLPFSVWFSSISRFVCHTRIRPKSWQLCTDIRRSHSIAIAATGRPYGHLQGPFNCHPFQSVRIKASVES